MPLFVRPRNTSRAGSSATSTASSCAPSSASSDAAGPRAQGHRSWRDYATFGRTPDVARPPESSNSSSTPAQSLTPTPAVTPVAPQRPAHGGWRSSFSPFSQHRRPEAADATSVRSGADTPASPAPAAVVPAVASQVTPAEIPSEAAELGRTHRAWHAVRGHEHHEAQPTPRASRSARVAKAPPSSPATPPAHISDARPPARPHRSWRNYATFAAHDAPGPVVVHPTPSVAVDASSWWRHAASTQAVVAAPPNSLGHTLASVRAETPGWATRPGEAFDAAHLRLNAAWQARLDHMLDLGARLDDPRPMLHRFVPERCAWIASERSASPLLGVRNILVERHGRAAANWVDRRTGQLGAGALAGPVWLVRGERAATNIVRFGDGLAVLAGLPLHATLSVAAAALGLLAVGCGVLGAGVGYAIGCLLAGAVLAVVPRTVLRAWLRGRALEASAHRRADAAYAWLHGHFGGDVTPATPQAQLHGLPDRPPRPTLTRAPLADASYAELEAQQASYRARVRHDAQEVGQLPAEEDDDLESNVAVLQQHAQAAQRTMPWAARALLGADAEVQLQNAHEELMHALNEGTRQRRIDRIRRMREARASEALPERRVDSAQGEM